MMPILQVVSIVLPVAHGADARPECVGFDVGGRQ
jgi:hypothetical protein